jgi:hypothetical protein
MGRNPNMPISWHQASRRSLPSLRLKIEAPSFGDAVSTEFVRDRFLQAADAWICDQYFIDIRYIEKIGAGGARVCDASILLSPIPAPADMSFAVETPALNARQLQFFNMKRASLMRLVVAAAGGQIGVDPAMASLRSDRPFHYTSESSRRDLWFSPLHLQVTGEREAQFESIDAGAIDGALRVSTPPFDGVTDLAGWLGLPDPFGPQSASSISIRIMPAVDLNGAECKLQGDRLRLSLNAHARLDTSKVGLAIRAAPGAGVASRFQASSQIKWRRPKDGLRVGLVDVLVPNADSALAMLVIGDSTVRRHWFVDPTKARNSRLAAIQQFDKDLRMIKQAVMESADASRFELGVAALLFLLGFTSAVQLETDAPDLVVVTPGGRLIIVECTMRIADFNAKLGKLIDRRGALAKSMQTGDRPFRVDAALVCALPRDQIASDDAGVSKHRVILITKEDLARAIERARFPADPDELMEAAFSHQRAAGTRFQET